MHRRAGKTGRPAGGSALEVGGGLNVHDLRIWPVGTGDVALTCHLGMPNGHQGDGFIDGAASRLISVFRISHATLAG